MEEPQEFLYMLTKEHLRQQFLPIAVEWLKNNKQLKLVGAKVVNIYWIRFFFFHISKLTSSLSPAS